MRGIDLSRPDTLYAVIWGCVILLAIFVPLAYIEPINNAVLFVICFNIFSFLCVYKVISLLINPRKIIIHPFESYEEIYIFRKFLKKMLFYWFIGYCINIAASGGLPLFWMLIGDTRTYVDYGLPTFSGFLNMMRAFVFVGCIIIFQKSNNASYLLIALVLLFTTILEVSRGGISVLLLHGICIWVMQKSFKPLKILLALVLFIFFIIGFGVAAEFRGHGVDITSLVGDNDFFLALPSGFFWVYTYAISPFNNLNYASNMGFDPLYVPYFTIQTLVPSVIREIIFPPFDYPIALASEAFNATSYYGPLFADFGYYGSLVIVFLLQIFISYCHIRAKKGSHFYYLVYPPFFMSIVMSIFYAYMFSMIVVMYPILAVLYMRYRRKFY